MIFIKPISSLVVALFLLLVMQSGFREQQKKFPRVREAYAEKQEKLEKLCEAASLDFSDQEIFIRAFKYEEELEVWARKRGQAEFSLLTTYDICQSSGKPGPKRQQGDRQVPEGFYHIDRFNPASSFHLSLGINYPNSSDRIKATGNPGGDIFIHGSCVTIGCIPLRDDKIKEVYILAVEAKNAGQIRIPVHVFPCRFNTENYQKLKDKYGNKDSNLFSFWENLKTGYEYFEKNKKLPDVSVDGSGNYVFR